MALNVKGRTGQCAVAATLAAMAYLVFALAPRQAFASEQAGGYKFTSSTNFEAFHGSLEIRTNPGTVTGVGYVHAMQMDVGPSGGNFVAIGTAKGLGVPGTGCADHYSGKWNIYTDGRSFGVYFCHDEALNAYAAGGAVPFTIKYGDCPGTQGNRWLLYMGGNFYQCVNEGSSVASRVMVMLETTGTSLVDRNIDVKYSGLQYYIQGSWVDLENAVVVEDFNYAVDTPGNLGKINSYLAPLD